MSEAILILGGKCCFEINILTAKFEDGPDLAEPLPMILKARVIRERYLGSITLT